MRRLVVLSLILVLSGLALLIPSSPLYNLLTTGSASGGAESSLAFLTSGGTNNTDTVESVLGMGLIAVGATLEFLSLFTDVGAAAPAPVSSPPKDHDAAPAMATARPAEKEGTEKP